MLVGRRGDTDPSADRDDEDIAVEKLVASDERLVRRRGRGGVSAVEAVGQ
jgi:hypothetical protein